MGRCNLDYVHVCGAEHLSLVLCVFFWIHCFKFDPKSNNLALILHVSTVMLSERIMIKKINPSFLPKYLNKQERQCVCVHVSYVAFYWFAFSQWACRWVIYPEGSMQCCPHSQIFQIFWKIPKCSIIFAEGGLSFSPLRYNGIHCSAWVSGHHAWGHVVSLASVFPLWDPDGQRDGLTMWSPPPPPISLHYTGFPFTANI